MPHYRHVAQLRRFLPQLEAAQLPLLVVDDGSGMDILVELRQLLAAFPWASLTERDTNGGKGAATATGLAVALGQGFSHVILVDADGQHDPDDIIRMHSESRQHPAALFSGKPRFGRDIPAARLYGREITNILARIEAGNWQLKDSMCGLRVYPVAVTLALCAECGNRLRMETDTELLVRACWRGLEVRYIDTEVVYPVEGASHFRMARDNLRLVLMHTRLLLAAVVQVPLASLRARNKQQRESAP